MQAQGRLHRACSSAHCARAGAPAAAKQHVRSLRRPARHNQGSALRASSSADDAASSSPEQPSTSGRDQDIDARLAEAQQELRLHWAALKAVTTGRARLGRPNSRQDSLPDRLLRVVSGQVFRPAHAGTKQQQQQQQQQQQLTGRASEASAAAAESEQQQLQQRQGQQGEAQPRATEQQQEGQQEVWLTATNMLVFATWAAFLVQWWSLLPDLAAAVLGGKGHMLLPQVLVLYPDTPATHMLQMDILAVIHGQGWGKIITSGLCHSGLAAMLMCTDGLTNVGRWLEPRMGAMQLLATFLAATLGSCTGQLLLGRAPVGVSGSGACVGMYAAWAVAALTRYRGSMPVTSDRGLVWTALNAVLAMYQPAIGLPSLLGGALGGAIGVLCAPVLAQGVALALGLPVMAVLFAAKVVVETVRLVATVAVTFVVATWRAGEEAVKTVRNL